MALPSRRFLGVVLVGAVLLVALAATASKGSIGSSGAGVALGARSTDAPPGDGLRPVRLARAAVTWRGGPITASTGEVVEVLVSDALPLESTPEGWAEFLVGLTHGSELSRLTTYIATFDEVQDICGSRALGCYSRNQMIALGEPAPNGTTAEEIVRHEYGHHVGLYRSNTPWEAIDWGPKRWASAADVCARVARREAFPGNEGTNYTRNPGEAWAETYRLMDERKAGVTTASWQIVSSAFFPSEAALQAAERDVLQPWTVPATNSFTRVFKRRNAVWLVPVQTPLDGDLRLSAAVPPGANYEIALLGADRKTVIRRAQWAGQRVKQLTGSVCGQRSLFVRVTQKGALGRVRVSVTAP